MTMLAPGLKLLPFGRCRLDPGHSVELIAQPQYHLAPRYVVFPVTMSGAWITRLDIGINAQIVGAGHVPAEAFMDPIWDRGITWGANLVDSPAALGTPRLPALDIEPVFPGQYIRVTIELPADFRRSMLAGGALLCHRVITPRR